MKRNVKSLVKFLMLSAMTVFVTVITFKMLRSSPMHDSAADYVESHNPFEQPKFEREAYNDLRSKIDWHDHTFIKDESERIGRGEQGAPAFLEPLEKGPYDELYKVNGFNAALSDKISIFRSVKDIRHEGCRTKKYLAKLNTVSVVVPFYDEHWSTLLRTAQSVISRSPPELLLEIILVDDGSTKQFLKKQLEDYVKANMTKIKIIRQTHRQGLIRARLAGARAATGEVLIFLDSHSEVSTNWLPPLLEPIAQDFRTCVCPFIDVINFETFEYVSQDEGARGAFDWEFYYKRLPLLPEDLKYPTEPFNSPVMAGGLFAISSKFFWELGGYDDGLMIWGGEQYELSFKIWQCGGRMLDAPCSRVGHIYRKFGPFPDPNLGNFLVKNFRRVLDVWMDEYAEHLYRRKPDWRKVDPGDLTAQKNLRKKLKCKSFKWFMEKVAFDLPKKFPMIEPEHFGMGEIRSAGVPELCVDTVNNNRDSLVKIQPCIQDSPTQNFVLSWMKDIKIEGSTMCFDVSSPAVKATITLYPCHGMQGNQAWRYDPQHQLLMHQGRCLDCDPEKRLLYVTNCDESLPTQKWRIEHVNFDALEKYDSLP